MFVIEKKIRYNLKNVRMFGFIYDNVLIELIYDIVGVLNKDVIFLIDILFIYIRFDYLYKFFFNLFL